MDGSLTKASLRARGICVIIPTYNNAGTIADVVTRALEQCDDVIVVADGCTDHTVELLNALPTPPHIVMLEKNQGKGSALKEGFRYALKEGFAYAITLDGDGQHFPEDIALMLEANKEHPGEIIVGQRKDLDKADRSRGSKFANAFSNFWFAVFTWKALKDTQTGYRLYPLKRLHALSLLTSRYEAELELLVFSSWAGVKIHSVPINVHYPPKEQRVSHFMPAKDFTRISLLNCVLLILSLIYGYPRMLLRFTAKVIKHLYLLTAFAVFALISMLILNPVAYLTKDERRVHLMICRIARFLIKSHIVPGISYKLQNPENEDFSKPSVIICNHQSHIDLILLLALSPNMIVLTTDWVWNNPIYRVIIRKAGFQPVSKGIDNIMPHLQNAVERGYSIAVYPEGTRSADCRIARFHQGAFHIAQSLNLDILPLVLYGSGKALPKKGHTMRRWPMELSVEKRISPSQLAGLGEYTVKQASAVRRYYTERYREMADRIEQELK
ncbi:MAG: glycosyltransferase [Bacteroidales bacterium]|nr:glycosyltransferase [Bacteroidales bacterium]